MTPKYDQVIGWLLVAADGLVPVRVFLCRVASIAKVKIFTHIAVNALANNNPLAVIASILHVNHVMTGLVTFRSHPTF